MSFKENLSASVEWGKKNPIIVLGLFILLLFIFLREEGREKMDGVGQRLTLHPGGLTPDQLGARVTGQRFPQPELRRDVVQHPTLFPQLKEDERPALIPGWRPRVDYDLLGSPLYREVIAVKHAAMVPGVPDRPRANGYIKTVAHGWQTPAEIMARQQVRYDRYRRAGQVEYAEKVRRETELAIGQRVGW